jgi:hypothetical protein
MVDVQLMRVLAIERENLDLENRRAAIIPSARHVQVEPE